MSTPKILISSPLEDEHVARIRREGGARVEVVHEADLLPTPRYVADHKGAPRTVTPAMQSRWAALLAEAEIMFDFDLLDPANMPRNAPKLRWVQATSSGIGEFLKKPAWIKAASRSPRQPVCMRARWLSFPCWGFCIFSAMCHF